MITYWTMFALPLLGGMAPVRPNATTQRLLYGLVFLGLTMIIGGRHVIGCDWGSYLFHFLRSADLSFGEALGQSYAAYSVLNWVVMRLGLDVHAVNTVCGAIFAFGLLALARRQPRPWLMLLAAIPYMTIVVAMGFTRQATALGLLMLAFNAFNDRKLVRYLVLVGLAGLFHSSAVVLAPLAVLIRRDQPLSPLIIGGAASAFLAVTILSATLDRYIEGYIESAYEAEGALYRLPLNALAGLAVLIYRKRWVARFDDARLYVIFALGSLAILPFAFVLPVMADRLSLYLLPFQVVVAARLPDLVARRFRGLTMLGVVLAYATALYVWLTYAHHADCWVPYDSIYYF